MSHPAAVRLFCAVALGACAAPARSGGLDPAPVLERVVVSPASANLIPGDTLSFHVVGEWSDGSSTGIAVSWAATGGQVTAGGRFRADSVAGSYRVIATTTDAARADTAQVIITTPGGPPVLTGVAVLPATVTLDPGDVVGFGATASYSDGSTAPIAATWSATGGSVTANGSYTAGNTPGSFRVVAVAQGLGDTAQVTVRDTTSPPPPPPPPPGVTVLLTEGFEDAQVGPRGWYDNTSPAISTVDKHGGNGALQMAFPVGATTPTKGGALRHLFAGTDRIYVSYWIKYSANWIGSTKTYHPHEFHVITDQDGAWVGPSTTHLTTYIEQNYQQGGIPRLEIQDALNIDTTKINVDLTGITENRSVAGCNGSGDGYPGGCYQSGTRWMNEKLWQAAGPAFLPNPGPGYKGDWHRVEVYFQLNSIQGGKGVADGIAQYWLDGQLLIDRQDVMFRTGRHPTMKFNQFVIAPYIGDRSTVAQALWVDDLTLATGRVP